MKTLILILMLMPLFMAAQINQNLDGRIDIEYDSLNFNILVKNANYIPGCPSDGLFNSTMFRDIPFDTCDIIFHNTCNYIDTVKIKSVKIELVSTDKIKNFDSKDEYGTLYLIDQLGKYFEECKKDSFVYGTTIRIISDTLSDNPSGNIIIRSGELIDLYKSKEPDLVGFYEWLKSKK